MEQLEALRRTFLEQRPASWENLPDLDLYMDQVLTYMPRQQVAAGERTLDSIDEQAVEDCLYTAGQPPVDLVLRPSGEYRLSNFLIWQSAYGEYVFMDDILWPDFKESDLDRAFEEFARRDRRFGGV